MKKILVPVDGSEISQKSADEAVELAKKFGSEVTFLSVLENKTFMFGGGIGIPINLEIPINSEIEMEKLHLKQYEELLDSLVEKYKSSGLVLSTKILKGIIDEEIEEFAKEGKFDLIVMGKRGLSRSKRFFVGSTTRKVIASAPCSVLVLKE